MLRGAADAGQGVGAVELFDLFELLGHQVQGFVPGGFAKRFTFADQRVGEAFGRVDEIIPEAPLDAQTAQVRRAFLHGGDFDHPAVLHMQPLLAADPAVGAGGAHLLSFTTGGQSKGLFLEQRAGGAGLQALAAMGAVFIIHQWVPSVGVVFAAAIGRGDGRIDLNLVAGLDATAAADAAAVVTHDHGGCVVQWVAVDFLVDAGHADLVFDGQVLKAAVAMGGTDLVMPGLLHDRKLTFTPAGLGLVHEQTVVGTGGQHHLQDGPARCLDGLAVGKNAHVGAGRGIAGGQELVAALHLHHADAAAAGGMGLFQMAQGGDDDVVLPGHL